MSSRNRVIWREGLFIKPQHFQQLQRHCDYQLHARVGALGDYGFGLLSLGINQDYLALGRIALDSGLVDQIQSRILAPQPAGRA